MSTLDQRFKRNDRISWVSFMLILLSYTLGMVTAVAVLIAGAR